MIQKLDRQASFNPLIPNPDQSELLATKTQRKKSKKLRVLVAEIFI